MSIVVLLLAFFGMSLEESTVANQEIVVQFPEGDISLVRTEQAVSLVKEQLQLLGVENIQVRLNTNGEALHITYYSAIDVSFVKQQLVKESRGQLGAITSEEHQEKTPVEVPAEIDFSGYQLNVSEIQSAPNAPSHLSGTLLEITTASELYFHPLVKVLFNAPSFQLQKNRDAVAYNAYGYPWMRILDAPYRIPEARAGPQI